MRGYAGPVVKLVVCLGLVIWVAVAGVTVPPWVFAVVLGLYVSRCFIARRWQLRWIRAGLSRHAPPAAPGPRRVLRGTVVKLNGQDRREQP